jgi:SAM-dependent methyltransferase
MGRITDPVLGQLRHPRGPLAPATARLLNLVNQPLNRFTVRTLELSGAEDVLDVGFGGGVGIGLVLQRLTTGRVAGIDISDEMADRARDRFADAVANGRLVLARADVAAIPFADGSFDRVYTVNTVVFWREVPPGLAEIQRVLRPGGRLVIAAPNAAFGLASIAGLRPRSGAKGLAHVKRLAEDAGFIDARLVGRLGPLLVARR